MNAIFVSHFSRFATTQYAIPLTNNVLVTSLIAGHIWYVTRDVRASGYATFPTTIYRRVAAAAPLERFSMGGA